MASEGKVGRVLAIAVLASLIGAIITVAMTGFLVNRYPEIDSAWFLSAPAFAPAGAFLGGLIIFGWRAGIWPLPSRGLRLLATFIVACLGGVTAYLSFAMVSYSWYAERLPPEKQSYVYLVFHPSEIPEVTELVDDYDRDTPTREFKVSWRPATVGAFFLAGFIVFAWSGRWDQI